MNKKTTTLLGFLGLYLISAALSWAVFSSRAKSGGESTNLSGLEATRAKIAQEPKTEECPINGGMFSKTERGIWEERRPILAMIENHTDSRPQSGLSRADVVYEAVAEGGITRFMGVFYCNAAAEDVTIGPVRSARVYFVNWASEYETPLYVHFGGANNICSNCPGGVKPRGDVAKEVLALEKLINMGWRHSQGNALDGGANVSYPTIWRDPERLGHTSAWEHSALGSTDLLYKLGIERGFGYENEDGDPWVEAFTKWKFSDGSASGNQNAKTISFEFWRNKPDFDVTWKYDPGSNTYKRDNGGEPHTDWEFDKPQLSASNIIVQFVDEEGPVDKELHMYYEVVGEGEVLIFQNGTVIEGTWEKPSQYERTVFYDEDGEEIPLVRGVTWIEALPTGNDVDYN